MIRKLGIVIICSLLMSITIYAFEGNENWKYSKKIYTGQTQGYKEIYMDEEIYKYSNEDLGDIRILNDQDEIIPYYRIGGEAVLESLNNEYNLEKQGIYQKENDKYFDFKVINNGINTDVRANELLIQLNLSNYTKNINIYGSHDNQHWDYIKSDIIYKVPDKEKNHVFLENQYKYNYYRVVIIKDAENTSIENIKLLYNSQYRVNKQYCLSKSIDYEGTNKNKKTIISIKNKDKLKIKTIKIGSDNLYNRNYTLSSKNGEDEYVPISNGKIYNIELENFKAINNSINISDFCKEEFLELTIDNKDDEPMDISVIEVDYYVDKIVFKRDKDIKDYKVIFGNVLVKKPSYDIESYSEYIEEVESKEKCTLGEINVENLENKVQLQEDQYKKILNGVIIIISIGLVILIILKLRHFPKNNK